jgi:DNA-binding transcriptional LysR family regulator
MATLREFEYLVAVAETGTVTAAAARLHVTQSALSQGLIALEKDFGSPLLHRDSRGVVLTAAGRAALPEARLALVAASRARRIARSVTGLDAGSVRVACAPSVTIGLLPAVLRRWHRLHPNIEVELEVHSSPHTAIEAVLSGQVDLVVGAGPRTVAGIEGRVLGTEELVVALSADDPAAGMTLTDLEPFAERRWVLFPAGHPVDQQLSSLAGAAGFTPRVAVRLNEIAAVVALAAAGLGPALVPHSVVLDGFSGALLRVGDGVRREIIIGTRNADTLTERFVEVLLALGVPELDVATGRFARPKQ